MRADTDFLDHEQTCSRCAEYARRTRASEIKLRAMLNVSPPPELAERIQLAARLDSTRSTPRRPWLGKVAGFALLVGALTVGWFVSPLERRTFNLADSVLHHIYDEAHHMREIGPVPQATINVLLARYGARLSGDLGTVNFAANCLMRKNIGLHLVLPGEFGPITVFFMPDESLVETMDVGDARFAGYIQPTAWGSIAVVGEIGERLGGVADKVLGSVSWPTTTHETASKLSPRRPRV